MSDSGRAIVLAPSPLLADAASLALTTEGYTTSILSADVLHASDLDEVLEGQNMGDAAVLVLGDDLFPPHPDADQRLTRGMAIGFHAVKLAMRGMLRRKSGRVVAVAPAPLGVFSRHAAVVGGLAGFMKSVAREVGSRGITANVVVQGASAAENLSPYVAVGRGMTIDDLTTALRFLTGPGSGYVTGSVLAVDGGLGL